MLLPFQFCTVSSTTCALCCVVVLEVADDRNEYRAIYSTVGELSNNDYQAPFIQLLYR